MSRLDEFWRHYERCCDELTGAQTVDQVIEICHRHFGTSSGDAFFPGGSGDVEILPLLVAAGWSAVWVEARYFFAIRQPDGKEGLTYVEGDIYRGVQQRV